MSEQKVIVGVAEFNALTTYLMDQPYKEVHQILEELRQSASVVEVPEQSEAQEETASDE